MRRLVLLGAGHAHLEVLRGLARRPLPGVEVTLVSPAPLASYTGMIPGFLAGRRAPEALTIPLSPLCARAGARLALATALRVDAAARRVESDAGAFAFDALSVDVGGEPAGLREVPGAATHAVGLRPLSNAALVRERVDAMARAGGVAPVVAVVGGGAAGVEVACAIHARIGALGAEPQVALVEAARWLLPGYPHRARRMAESLLRERGIWVGAGRRVTAVEAGAMHLDDGRSIPAALVVWLAGTAAPPLVAASGLARDDGGFLLVDDTLRAADGAPVWGAGDCAAIAGHPLPRAGVYAVRAAPALAHNLRAFLLGGRPVRWRPRREVLALLDTADGRALLRWGGLVLHGRAALRLKDAIDERWVARFR